jgi:hypothetical protein
VHERRRGRKYFFHGFIRTKNARIREKENLFFTAETTPVRALSAFRLVRSPLSGQWWTVERRSRWPQDVTISCDYPETGAVIKVPKT